MFFAQMPNLQNEVDIYLDVVTGELTTLNDSYPKVSYELDYFVVQHLDGTLYKREIVTVQRILQRPAKAALQELAIESYTLMRVLTYINVRISKRSRWYTPSKRMTYKHKHFRSFGQVTSIISRTDSEDEFELYMNFPDNRHISQRSHVDASLLNVEVREVMKKAYGVESALTYQRFNKDDCVFEVTDILIK